MNDISLTTSTFAAQLVTVVRSPETDTTIRIAEAIAAGGVRFLEIAVNADHNYRALEQLRSRLPDCQLGAGSVLGPDAAQLALSAGATYLVSPGYHSDVHKLAREAGVPYVAGVMTATEVMTAAARGLTLLKLFPAGAAGGPDLLQALRAPFPELHFMPTGGVDLANMEAYLRAGAYALGVGGSLASLELAAQGRWEAMTALAERYVELMAELEDELD